MDTDRRSQAEKFADLARVVEADPDPKAWDERLRRIAAKRPDKFFTPEQVLGNLAGLDDPERQKRGKPAQEKDQSNE